MHPRRSTAVRANGATSRGRSLLLILNRWVTNRGVFMDDDALFVAGALVDGFARGPGSTVFLPRF